MYCCDQHPVIVKYTSGYKSENDNDIIYYELAYDPYSAIIYPNEENEINFTLYRGSKFVMKSHKIPNITPENMEEKIKTFLVFL